MTLNISNSAKAKRFKSGRRRLYQAIDVLLDYLLESEEQEGQGEEKDGDAGENHPDDKYQTNDPLLF